MSESVGRAMQIYIYIVIGPHRAQPSRRGSNRSAASSRIIAGDQFLFNRARRCSTLGVVAAFESEESGFIREELRARPRDFSNDVCEIPRANPHRAACRSLTAPYTVREITI